MEMGSLSLSTVIVTPARLLKEPTPAEKYKAQAKVGA
jgi:hypothetical protein